MSAPCKRCGLLSTLPELELCPRCLLLGDDDEEPEVPSVQLPGLELRRLLGRGGMGQVFLARHSRLDREVAVKLINPELSAAPFLARFEREARAQARLHHPHVIAIFDFGVTPEGTAYIVMEYASGGTLASKLPLSADQAVSVGSALADALRAAHDAGLVHRDIKPENVLFDSKQTPKLADFGLARAFTRGEDGLTNPAWIAGTPIYMAPEALAGAAPHPASDQYALGVLLREMLTGSPRPSRAIEPPSLARIIARATAELPEQRFPDIDHFAAALAEVGGISSSTHESTSRELPPDERSWLQAVSLMFAGASAAALYAVVISFTPRVMRTEDAVSMIAFGTRPLGEDRVFTQARFEVWPTLTAAAAFAVALASYGLLRRHWRQAGLERRDGERPIESATLVLRLGAGLLLLFVLHRSLEHSVLAGVGPYLPVLGGTLEFLLLYLVWLSLLEAVRCQRPLWRERRLWLGFSLGLVPPTLKFVEALTTSR